MKTFTGIEYLAIDIANQMGLEKETFETRIQWVRDNQDSLEALADQAETKPLYLKAVAQFRKALKGLPIGHTVALDSVCSGLQLMSVLTGCPSGCYMTGLIDPEVRMDAYSKVTGYMNELLDTKVEVSRADAKQAVMVSLYGSMAKPKEIFGDGTPEYRAFYRVLETKAKGAYWLLGVFRKLWNSEALVHEWTLPDGYRAYIPNMVKKEDRVSVAELDYTMSVVSYENEAQEKGISLCANSIHSIDSYVLRSLVRRCNYNPNQVKAAADVIEIEILSRGTETTDTPVDLVLQRYVDIWKLSQMVDVVIIQHLNMSNAWQVPTELLKQLNVILTQMLKHPPFELITVHDSYASHVNNCNAVRYWYKEILAELADSNTLAYLLGQLINDSNATYTKIDPNLGSLIRKSNYALS